MFLAASARMRLVALNNSMNVIDFYKNTQRVARKSTAAANLFLHRVFTLLRLISHAAP
jgi:hypothetical protein